MKVLKELCRVCLSDSEVNPIFGNGPVWQTHIKIMECAAVHIESDDPLPNQICRKCHQALEIAYLFKFKCEQMDRYLRKLIEEQLSQLTETFELCIDTSTIPVFNGFDHLQSNHETNESAPTPVKHQNGNIQIDLPASIELEYTQFDDKTNGDMVMYFDNDEIQLGEECEVVSNDIQPTSPRCNLKNTRSPVKEDFIPEPAAFVETETEEEFIEEHLEDEISNIVETVLTDSEEEKFKHRRSKKIDKYKAPHGVSYLKSGRKIPVLPRKSKRFKDSTTIVKLENGVEVYTKPLPIVRRARVEKLTPNKRVAPEEEGSNRLLSDKQLKYLNEPQKQALCQRLKLQSQRPTSKKDISERGCPEIDKEVRSNSIRHKNTISDDLAIINQNLQTIDQDLKLINGETCTEDILRKEDINKDGIENVSKTGRHTAIKSKRPQKRNFDSDKNSSLPRKSERQRAPKKIFPEIDMYTNDSIKQESDEAEEESADESESEASSQNDKDTVNLDYGSGLTCNVCSKSFPYRSHLIRHVRTHTGLKPYTCVYCKKNFTSLSSLNMHVKIHEGDLPFKCEVCHRGFVQPSVLKRHMLSHTGEHPYQCKICFNTFVHDSSLKTHLKMHTIREPQHKCDICDKRFRYLSTLTSHQKTHSGIKPFTCPECRKAFYRRSLLTRHMRSHTKERPYKCKLCKARFGYSGGLASHKKLHTGVRPYQCNVCDFTFFRSSHLKNHMMKIHNNGVVLKCDKCHLNFDSNPLFKQHLSLHNKQNDE